MASDSRFYQLELRHRPAVWGDVGSLLKIEGVVVGGEGAHAIMLLPTTEEMSSLYSMMQSGKLLIPTVEEWTDWLQRSDNPEILVNGSLEKVFHRKLRYEISGATQQRIWAADGFKCVFCKQPMGRVQLSVDHWFPLEMGGANDTSNYLSCCRRENKDKGSMPPQDWCKLKGLDFDYYVEYLKNRSV